MKIYPNPTNGRVSYFEVSSLLTRYGAVRFVKTIPGVEIVSLTQREDVFCTFRLGSRIFEIWEPWGDNSRFHISEKNAVDSDEIERLKAAFESYKPWPLSWFSSRS